MVKYVIISPVRNEEDFLETTIRCVIDQTIRPVEYILVNDGSTDRSADIMRGYASRYDWIKVIDRPKGEHSPGPGVVAAFYAGYDLIATTGWEYIVKLDGDLRFDPGYFEFQIRAMERNPALGMTSGKTYQPHGDKLVLDMMPDDHVRGPAKFYRRACFEAIGGLLPVLGWDTIDEMTAQTLGWETRSYQDLVLVHYKPIGFKQKNVYKRETRLGKVQHYLGYHPLFALVRGLYVTTQKPYVIGGLLNIAGFLTAGFRGDIRYGDKAMIRHLRKKQLQRLFFKRRLLG